MIQMGDGKSLIHLFTVDSRLSLGRCVLTPQPTQNQIQRWLAVHWSDLLYYITLHYIILYYIILHYITLHYMIWYHIILYYIILILGFNLFQAETFADVGCSQQSFGIGHRAGLGSTWRIIKGSWTRRKMVTGRLSIEAVIEFNDGKIYRKPPYLMIKTMVSCRFSL